jgi:hypothetical protein
MGVVEVTHGPTVEFGKNELFVKNNRFFRNDGTGLASTHEFSLALAHDRTAQPDASREA